jgi:hypothetical protein
MNPWKSFVAAVAGIATLLVYSSPAFSQCSDAGICSIESALHDRKHQTINFDYIYGASDSSLTYATYQLSGDIDVFTGTRIWASLPLVMTEGPLGGVSGIGDLIIVVNQKLFEIAGAGTFIDFGTRLATGTQNAGDSLPLKYQTGLGSNDLMFGLSVVSDNINVGIGYQLNGGRSANEITRLKRGDDFIVRGGYMHRGESIDFGGELLAIKKLEEQSIFIHFDDSLGQEVFTNLPNSDAFQLNALLKARWNIANSFALTGSVGFPLLERKVSVDGLTRAYTLTAGVAVKL